MVDYIRVGLVELLTLFSSQFDKAAHRNEINRDMHLANALF